MAIKKVHIGFSSPNKFMIGASLIQFWMRTNYSHSYLRFEDEEIGVSMVFQAAHGMVHFMEFENFKSVNKVVKEYEIALSDEDFLETKWECVKLAAQKYGYIELAKITIYDIANYFGKKIDFKDSRGYVCSELMGQLCMDRLKMRFKKPKHLLTPKDIDLALEAKGYSFIIYP